MQPKTNRKRPDRIILFEIGLIAALLFVHYMLNFEYRVDLSNPYTQDPSWDEETAYVLGEIIEPQPEIEPEPPKRKEIIEASIFDPRALIKEIDELFETKDEIIAPPSFTPPGPIGPIIVKERIDSSSIVHDFVDRMPEFPGGEIELRKFIVNNFDIPEAMYDYGEDVQVVVEFVIDQKGKLSDFKILNCSKKGFGLEREARETYEAMPTWEPGLNNGKQVKVRLRQPIKIQIH